MEAFSADHGAALLKDGRMFLWGSNRFGQSTDSISLVAWRVAETPGFVKKSLNRERFGANFPAF